MLCEKDDGNILWYLRWPSTAFAKLIEAESVTKKTKTNLAQATEEL